MEVWNIVEKKNNNADAYLDLKAPTIQKGFCLWKLWTHSIYSMLLIAANVFSSLNNNYKSIHSSAPFIGP